MRTPAAVVLVIVAAGGVTWAVASRSGGAREATSATSGAIGHGETTRGVNAEFDQLFIDDMVPHQEMAVKMAKVVLEHGRRPELRELAQTIATNQTGEIHQMKSWRTAWFGSSSTPVGPDHAVPGMDHFFAVEGAEDVDRTFLDEMILHHQDAVEWAQEAQSKAWRTEIRDLAGRVVLTQETEIRKMELWRSDWYGG